MALIPKNDYAGRIITSDPSYPQGKATNIVGAVEGTGTPTEAAWVNDIWGLQQSLLTEGDVTPSGAADTGTTSQYLESIKKITATQCGSVKLLLEATTDTTAREGDYVTISDRGYGYFQYQTGQTPNGFDIIPCTGVPSLSLNLIDTDKSVAMYGADIDGITDYSDNFLAASSTSRSVLVEVGDYNLPTGGFTGYLFHSFGEVTSNNATLTVINLSTLDPSAATTQYVIDSIDTHNDDPLAHPALSSFITGEADRAEAAADEAEAARDAAITMSQGLYPDTASGIADTVDGEYFSVPVSGSFDSTILYLNNSGVADEITRYPSSQRVYGEYTKGQDTLVNEAYNEKYEFFDISTIVATNLDDGAAINFTPTLVSDGLQIQLSTNRLVAFTTANKTGNSKTRLKYKGIISTGSSGATGISFYNGFDRSYFRFQGNIGRFIASNVDNGGIVSDGIGPLSSTLTVEMELIIDADEETVALKLILDGGSPYTYKFSGVTLGDIELIQDNTSTSTHSLEISAVGEFTEDSIAYSSYPEVSNVDRNTINAAMGLLNSMQRTVPTGWNYDIPNGYSFYENSKNYFSSIDLRPILNESDPEVLVIYVDIVSGDDANNGTETSPLKSLNVAASRCIGQGKIIIKAMGGLYPYANCLRNTIQGSMVQIESWDGESVISSMHDDTLNFSLDTGNTYVASLAVGSISSVFDAKDLTSEGDYGAMNLASSLNDCRNTISTYFVDGTDVYVHLYDGRSPDSNLRVYTRFVGGASDSYGVRQTTDGQTLYMENIHIEGGELPYSTRAEVGEKINCLAKNCTTKYGLQNGTNITSDGLQVWQNSVAAWNGDDGFNYKGSPFGGISCLGVEIDCIGRWNGRDTEGTNNGSTQHGGPVIRVNGEYHNNQDRNVHDIDANSIQTLSWNMNCISRDAQTVNSNFAAGISGGGDQALMWLDNCISSGSSADIESNADTVVYTFDFTGDGNNIINDNGVITTYTP